MLRRKFVIRRLPCIKSAAEDDDDDDVDEIDVNCDLGSVFCVSLIDILLLQINISSSLPLLLKQSTLLLQDKFSLLLYKNACDELCDDDVIVLKLTMA